MTSHRQRLLKIPKLFYILGEKNDACEKLILKTLTPVVIKSNSIFLPETAGPKVATIFVFFLVCDINLILSIHLILVFQP